MADTADLPVLQGSVTLRPWRPGDAEDLERAMQDPEIERWLGDGEPYTRADAEHFIDRSAQRWRRGEAAHFAVTEDGHVVGYLGVLREREDVWELVYWVTPEARGSGVATRAIETALPWIDDTLRPNRLEAGMLAGNEASAAAARRAGFELVEVRPGTGTLDGAPADEWVFVLAD